MKIKITEPCTVRLNFQPGDTIEVSKMTPELEGLLNARTITDTTVARLVGNRQELERAVSVT